MNKIKKSKATRNYYVDIIAFLPFLLLLITGIVMLKYHSGASYDVETIGLNGNTWISIHKALTVIAVPIVIFHLILHFDWIKKLFTLQLKNKHRGVNITLFLIFLLCASTSLLSWLVFAGSGTDQLLRGLHNKLGILLILFFTIHLITYFKWIFNMTKRAIKK